MTTIDTVQKFLDYVFTDNNLVAIAGLARGDEGKGKQWSQFEHMDIDFIAWPNGWWNAGHNVVLNGEKIALHELPGWAINHNAQVYLWQSKLINIVDVIKELDQLKDKWLPMKVRDNLPKLVIAGNANINLSSLSGKLDLLCEIAKSKPVGTTKKWIGPTVALQALRTGIKFHMLDDDATCLDCIETNCNLFNANSADIFKDKDGNFIDAKIETFKKIALKERERENFDQSSTDEKAKEMNRLLWLNADEIVAELTQAKQALQKKIDAWIIIIDHGDMLLNHAYHSGKKIVIEHAQSIPLSVFGGHYPNQTSTDTSFNGAYSSLNIPPSDRHSNIGVCKAVESKVWSWYFPTQVKERDEQGNRIEWTERVEEYREMAGERGATTGRARDLGYLDLVKLRKDFATNNVNVLAINMLDLIKHFNGGKYKIGMKYRNKSTWQEYIDSIPTNSEYGTNGENIDVEYSDEFDLSADITGIADFDKLPDEYKRFIACIVKETGFKGIVQLGTWPAGDQTIVTSNFTTA